MPLASWSFCIHSSVAPRRSSPLKPSVTLWKAWGFHGRRPRGPVGWFKMLNSLENIPGFTSKNIPGAARGMPCVAQNLNIAAPCLSTLNCTICYPPILSIRPYLRGPCLFIHLSSYSPSRSLSLPQPNLFHCLNCWEMVHAVTLKLMCCGLRMMYFKDLLAHVWADLGKTLFHLPDLYISLSLFLSPSIHVFPGSGWQRSCWSHLPSLGVSSLLTLRSCALQSPGSLNIKETRAPSLPWDASSTKTCRYARVWIHNTIHVCAETYAVVLGEMGDVRGKSTNSTGYV